MGKGAFPYRSGSFSLLVFGSSVKLSALNPATASSRANCHPPKIIWHVDTTAYKLYRGIPPMMHPKPKRYQNAPKGDRLHPHPRTRLLV